MLNKTDLAGPLGVSVPTITQWLRVLEATAQILIVPPFYENLGKRLVHQGSKVMSRIEAVAPGVRAIEWRELLESW